MKKVTTIVAVMSIAFVGLSQNNEISIESYQSFRFGNTNEYEISDTDYADLVNGVYNAGFSYSFGLNYVRKFKNDWFLRARPGISLNSRNEDINTVYYNQFANDMYESNIELRSKNTSVNLFVGAGKEIKLTDRFSLDVGLDIGFLADISNSYSYKVESEYQFVQDYYYEIRTFQHSREFAKNRRIGVMPIISPKFCISDHFSVSMELQYLAMFSFSKGNETYTIKDDSQEFSPNVYSGNSITTKGTIDANSSLFSASKISPLVRITYRF